MSDEGAVEDPRRAIEAIDALYDALPRPRLSEVTIERKTLPMRGGRTYRITMTHQRDALSPGDRTERVTLHHDTHHDETDQWGNIVHVEDDEEVDDDR